MSGLENILELDRKEDEEDATASGLDLPEEKPATAGIFDDLLDRYKEEDEGRYGLALDQGLKSNPEQAAKVQQLSSATGLDDGTVERNLAEVELGERKKELDYQSIVKDNPVLAQRLADMRFAQVAHDDVENLGLIEKTLYQLYRTPENLTSGTSTAVGMSLSGIGRTTEKLQLPMFMPFADPLTRLAADYLDDALVYAGDAVQEFGKAMRPDGKPTYIDQITQGIGQFAGQMVATAVAPWVAVPMMFGQGVEITHQKIQEDPQALNDPQLARDLEEITGGFITGVTEYLSTKFALNIPGSMQLKSKLFDFVLKVAKGGSSEAIQETSEDIFRDLAHLITNENSEINFAEALHSGGVGGWVGAITQAVINSVFHIKARNTQRIFSELNDATGAQALRDRSPDQYKSFADGVAGHLAKTSEGTVEEVYIDAETFSQTMTEAGVRPDEVKTMFPKVAEQMEEAKQVGGGDIRLPMNDWIGRVAGTEIGEALTPHLRTSAEALSALELAEVQARQGSIQEQAEIIMAENIDNAEFTKSAKRVENIIFDQTKAIKNWPDRMVRNYATFANAFIIARAKGEGMTPEQVYERYSLKIRKGVRSSATILNQARDVGYPGDNNNEAAEWLAAKNKGLDMSQEARLQRAEDQGKDTDTIMYRGSRSDEQTQSEFYTPDSDYASTYSSVANIVDGSRYAKLKDEYLPFMGDQPNVGQFYVNRPYRLSENPEDRAAFTEWFKENYDLNPAWAINGRGESDLYGKESGEISYYWSTRLIQFLAEVKPEGWFSGAIAIDEMNGHQAVRVLNPGAVRSIYAAFDPDASDSSNILAQSTASMLAEDKLWRNWKPQKTKAGKLIGMPEWVKSDKDVGKLKRMLRKYIREGVVGRYWYEGSAEKIMEIVGGDVQEAERFIQVVAIYSQQANVDTNTGFAVKAWNQYKAGLPIKVKSGVQNKKASDVLYKGKDYEGRKTNSFYKNLMHDIVANATPEQIASLKLDADLVEQIDKPVTIDVWMRRAFNFKNPGVGDDKGKGGYSVSEDLVRHITALLNGEQSPGQDRWTPHQVQAAVWTAMKARYEIPEVKAKTWKQSIARGIGTLENGKKKRPTTAEGKRKHDAIWQKNAVAVTSAVATEAATRSKADFSDYLDQMTEVITWETQPSKDLGLEIFDEPAEVQKLFDRDATAILVSEDGSDLLAEELGVSLAYINDGTGGYDGGVHANNLSHLVVEKEGAGQPYQRRDVTLYARAIQYIFKQDAVPWFRADPRAMSSIKAREQQQFHVWNLATNKLVPGSRSDTLAGAQSIAEQRGEGFEVRGGKYQKSIGLIFDKPLTPETEQRILELMGEGAGFTKTAPNELSVINFRDEKGIPHYWDNNGDKQIRPDEEFEAQLQDLVDTHSVEFGIIEIGRFWSEGEYGEQHDWKQDPEGQNIIEGLSEGSPDLQAWVRGRRKAFEEVLDQYSGANLKARRAEAGLDDYWRGSGVLNQQALPHKNELGFYSAAEQAALNIKLDGFNPSKKNPDGHALGKEIWNRLWSASSKKTEKAELHYLGLEEFLNTDPTARFSREAVIQYIRQNGVHLEETMADEESGSSESTVEFGEVRTLSDRSHWGYQVEEALEEYDSRGAPLGLNSAEQWLMEWVDNQVRDGGLLLDEYVLSDEDIEIIENEGASEWLETHTEEGLEPYYTDARDDFEKYAESIAFSDYMENPNYLSPALNVEGLYIQGNNENWWQVYFREGDEAAMPIGTENWNWASFTEAQIQAQRFAEEKGLIGASEFKEAKWGDRRYNMGGSYHNYREQKMILPEITPEFIKEVHFPDANIIAFNRLSDRELVLDGRPLAEGEGELETTPEIEQMEAQLADEFSEEREQEIRALVDREVEKALAYMAKTPGLENDLRWAEANKNNRESWHEIINRAQDPTVSQTMRPQPIFATKYDNWIKAKRKLVKLIGLEYKIVNDIEARRARLGLMANSQHIEESQSDMDTKGRKHGYATGRNPDSLDKRASNLRAQAFGDPLFKRLVNKSYEEADDLESGITVSKAQTNRLWAEAFEFGEKAIDSAEEKMEQALRSEKAQVRTRMDKAVEELEGYKRRFTETERYEDTFYPKNLKHREESIAASKALYDDLERQIPMWKSWHKGIKEDWLALTPDEYMPIHNKLAEADSLHGEAQLNRDGAPDFPFKNNEWMSLMLKRAIVDAVERGMGAISWSNPGTLQARWGEGQNYNFQYNEKMPSIFRKITGIEPKQLTREGNEVTKPGVFVPPTMTMETTPAQNPVDGKYDTTGWTAGIVKRYDGAWEDDVASAVVRDQDGVTIWRSPPLGKTDKVSDRARERWIAEAAKSRLLTHPDGMPAVNTWSFTDSYGQFLGVYSKEVSPDPAVNAESAANAEKVLAGHIDTYATAHGNLTSEPPKTTVTRNAEDPQYFDVDIGDVVYNMVSHNEARNLILDMLMRHSTPVQGYWIAPITDELREQVKEQGFALFQDGADERRGGFDPANLTMLLNKDADYSTFLHETAHFFLEVYSDLATDENASDQVKEDMQVLLDWFGVESLASWNSMSLNERRAKHEQFAYNFELYLFEGKSPSIRMQTLFDRFGAWLRRVYRSIKEELNAAYKEENGTDLPIMTSEVRQVMDRMLASEEQIEQAIQIRKVVPIYQTQEESGMSDAQWLAYQALNQEAVDAQIMDLSRDSVRQMKWLGNAKSRIIKDLQKRERATRKLVRDEVLAETETEPVYAAMQWLRFGEAIDENGDKITLQNGAKLKADLVEALYPEGSDAPDIKKLGKGKWGMMAEEGLDPELAAEMFGFESADQLIRALTESPTLKDEVNARTDKRMLEEHGELTDPKAMEDAVNEALHNEARAKFIAAELRHQSRVQAPVRVMQEAARRAAQLVIAGKPINDIRPKQYAAQEGRAARDVMAAMKRGDTEGTTAALQAKLLNNQLASESIKAQDEVTKIVNKFKRLQKRGAQNAMRGDFLDQLNYLFGRFDLRMSVVQSKRSSERLPLFQWVESEADRVHHQMPELPLFILDDTFRRHYKDLTMDQLRDLRDTVEQLEHMARHENEMYQAVRQQSYEQEKGGNLAELRSIRPEVFDDEGKPKKFDPKFKTYWGEKRQRFVSGFDSWYVNLETMLDIATAGRGKAIFESLFGRLSTAADKKNEFLIKMGKYMKKANSAYTLAETKMMATKKMRLRSGVYYTREQRIAIVMFFGSKEGRQRLEDGNELSMGEIREVIDSLDEKDIDLIRTYWNMSEELIWPELRDLNERTLGVAPPKVEAMPFQTRFGQLPGGYTPLVYNGEMNNRSHKNDLKNSVTDMLGTTVTNANTTRSASKARLEVVKQPLDLSLGAINRKLNETVHDITHREAVADTHRMMVDTDISNALKNILGVEAWKEMELRIRQVAVKPRSTAEGSAKWLLIARRNTLIHLMGHSVKTFAVNVLGILPAMGRVGVWRYSKAMASFPYSLGEEGGKFSTEKAEWILAKSSYMRNRMTSFDRDLNEEHQRMIGKNRFVPPMSFWFAGLAGMDRFVTMPLWVAAYEKGMDVYTNDDTAAVMYADRVVRQSQGAGRQVDLTAVSTNEMMKPFTMFYNFFAGMLMTMRRTHSKAGKQMSDGQIGEAAGTLALAYLMNIILPATLESIMKEKCGEDPDLGDYALCTARSSAFFAGSLFPIIRDVVPPLYDKVFNDEQYESYGYNITPLADTGESFIRLGEQVGNLAQGEEVELAKVIKGMGPIFGLPGLQTYRTLEGYRQLVEGETTNPMVLLWGPEK